MRVGLLAVSAALVLASAAGAKEFEPGDLRVCNAKRCVAITNPDVLGLVGGFYYDTQSPPAVARAPRIGAPTYELRFRNGYATGIVSSTRLDRFLSFGVHLGHFQQGTWYRLPDAFSVELRKLTNGLAPLRLTRAAIRKSR